MCCSASYLSQACLFSLYLSVRQCVLRERVYTLLWDYRVIEGISTALPQRNPSHTHWYTLHIVVDLGWFVNGGKARRIWRAVTADRTQRHRQLFVLRTNKHVKSISGCNQTPAHVCNYVHLICTFSMQLKLWLCGAVSEERRKLFISMTQIKGSVLVLVQTQSTIAI